MNLRRRRRRQGFTLIELLVVISIIGILVGLLLPAINSAREAGRRAQCQSNMRNVVLAILGYSTNNNSFPPAGDSGEDATTNIGSASTPPDPSTSVIMSVGARWRTARTACRCIAGSCRSCRISTARSCLTSGACSLDRGQHRARSQQRRLCRTLTAVRWELRSVSPTSPPARPATSRSANTAIGVLRCPDDNTVQVNQGNLSYVVNGGFALYHANPVGWVGSNVDGGGTPSGPHHLVNHRRCNQSSSHRRHHAEAGRDVPPINISARHHELASPGTSARHSRASPTERAARSC